MIESKLSLTHRIVQADGNIVSSMDGNTVMLNVAKGKYFNLGTTGGDIWEAIQRPATVEEVVTSLLTVYSVEKEQCELNVIVFLERLHEEDLIRLCD
jgi:hypothetical protein